MNLSIKQLNERIKGILHNGLPNKVKITGEVNSIRSSGDHQYIIFKDDASEIHGVIWNVSTKNIVLEEKKKYEVYGTIDTYVKNCSVQINVQSVSFISFSDKLLELKTKLQKEGLFDKKKQSLPENITNIGVLTSLDSAALTDVMSVLTKNDYRETVTIKHCSVQGKTCVNSVVEGIKWFDDKDVDVLIITRGGGSDTELAYYSDEKIVRAVYESKHCIISAIGHARDNVLCDEAADITVTTPTNAGQLVSKKQPDDLKDKLDELYDLIINKMRVSHQQVSYRNYDKDILNLKQQTQLLLRDLQYKTQLLTQNILITTVDGVNITSLKMFNKHKSDGIQIHFADGICEL